MAVTFTLTMQEHTGAQPPPPTVPAPQKDFGSCLMPALLAALPAFLQALVACMQGNGGGGQGEYSPGDRSRC